MIDEGTTKEKKAKTPVLAYAGSALDSAGAEAVYYFHCDHLGTPQAITDENGGIVWKADYSPFGEITLTAAAVENNFRFPGQCYDKETGLHYNWHRYYDAGTGRYLRSDPIGLDGGMNLFAYAKNNPVIFIDPKGLVCGSRLTDKIIPDAPGGFDFTKACKKHDNCYGKCLGKTAWYYKTQCDKKFYEDMKEKCCSDYSGNKECLRWAEKYYWGVNSNSLAERAFLNAQVDGECPGAVEFRLAYYQSLSCEDNLLKIYF